MAGEIEDPYRLDFRVDSLHSGSVSFGRFESEALCWERRSSFSHNRYPEEVEKCSKPGSVTEKRAYFEAHFRKKGFPILSSPECPNETDHQTSENGTPEKTCNDEENDHMNASTRSVQFDASVDGSLHGGDREVTECETEVFGISFSEPQFEHASDGTSNVDCISEHVKVDKADDAELGSSFSINCETVIDLKESLDGETANLHTCHESNMAVDLFPDNYVNEEISNVIPKDQQSSPPKENTPSKSEHTKPRYNPRVTAGQSRRYISSSTSKGSESKSNNKVQAMPVRFKAEKKTSRDPNKYLMHKTTKYEHGSQKKGVDEINSGVREPRNRTIVGPPKVSSRAYQSSDRGKPAVGETKPGTRQNTSRFSFKSNERPERRKELDMKLDSKMAAKEAEMHQTMSKTQEKTQADMKQLRKSLSFKAIPMPSFYCGSLCMPDGNKAIPCNTEQRKQQAKSSIPGIRLSEGTLTAGRTKAADPPGASGVTSCHSTLTSDSSASSSTRASKDKPSQTGNSPTSWKKGPEKEKLTNLHKHKVPEDNQIHKGKAFDAKQKTRTGRSTYQSFNSSSRAGHMVVRVAS